MAKFKVTFETSTYEPGGDRTEEVEADDFANEGDWTTFRRMSDTAPNGVEQVLRVRQKDVKRIDRLN